MSEEHSIIDQSLAVCNMYYKTGQRERGDELWTQLQSACPQHHIIKSGIASDLAFFGTFWRGQNLDGKSIEIFCDQGMGDIINMLRYLELMKREWPYSKIILNCYGHYDCLKRLFDHIPYVDHFVKHHCVCDFFSNIFSIPTIVSGIKLDVPYPAHFKLLLERGIPTYTPLPIGISKRKMNVGIAWESNVCNELAKIKSMSLDMVERLVDSRWDLYSLLPGTFGVDFLKESHLQDLYDTATIISLMDVVVSVDTAVLHLAGAMNKKTCALLVQNPDPRWALNCAVWYPTMTAFRQLDFGDWTHPLKEAKRELDSFYQRMDEIGFFFETGALHG